jgi:hypothetical protein
MQRTSKRREERTEGNARPPNTPARPATVVTNQAANTPRWRIQGYERGSEAPSTHTHALQLGSGAGAAGARDIWPRRCRESLRGDR